MKNSPPVAKATTSNAVKSGFLKVSTSKFGPQGRTWKIQQPLALGYGARKCPTLINSGADWTSLSYFAERVLLTMAVKPGKASFSVEEIPKQKKGRKTRQI